MPSAGADVSAFPHEDPYRATVFGTPAELRATVPEHVPYDVRSLRRFPEREVPPIFRNGAELAYGFSPQDGRAPLAYVIAGTGGAYDESRALFLHRALYGAGFHVVSLSSPTHPNFVTAASTHGTVGYLPDDARDLHAVMASIEDDLASEIDVSSTVLTGYSLGATQAAFVASLDAREPRFGFERIVLLNPSVSLYHSARRFDALYERVLPGGVADAHALFEKLLRRGIELSRAPSRGRLDGDFLYAMASGVGSTDEVVRSVVAAVFRLTAANVAFAADAIAGDGAILPAGSSPGIGTSLTPFLERSLEWSFGRYVDEILLPRLRRDRPELDLDRAIRASSLERLGAFLRRSPHVTVITNEDDFILRESDLEFLRATFGERAVLRPNGGHCGNLESRATVELLLERLCGGDCPGGDAR